MDLKVLTVCLAFPDLLEWSVSPALKEKEAMKDFLEHLEETVYLDYPGSKVNLEHPVILALPGFPEQT